MKLFLRVLIGLTALVFVAGVLAGCSKKSEPEVEVVEDETPPPPPPPPPRPEPKPEPVDVGAWKHQVRDVYFDYDKYDLRSDARALLQENARLLKENPDFRLVLEGHCDERGTEQYNLALGQRRADAVKDYLADLGITGTKLETISYGEERPFATGGNESAWSQNRRVHFTFR
jgi:peptidoglycan-associated lipoprotein